MAEEFRMTEYNKFEIDEVGCIPTLDRMNSCLGPASPTALVWALEKGNLQLFSELLLDLDAVQINEELADHSHSTILHLATLSGKVDFVRELLRRREVNPNYSHRIQKRFPIHVAAEQGNNEIISLLLDCGADINSKMENGDTALHVLGKQIMA